jgi:putative transposase
VLPYLHTLQTGVHNASLYKLNHGHLVPKLCFGTHFREAPLRVTMPRYRSPQPQPQQALMTHSRYRIFETTHPYFMTCTIVGWLPVFTRPEAVNLIFNSWRFLQGDSGFQLFAYVILENHLHLVASAPDLRTDMQRFKSYTARTIVDLLEQRNAHVLLRQLRAHKLRHKKESEYQVWQEGSHPEKIKDTEMMLQKIEYIHDNPVARGYVDEAVHWRYSSARNYAGRQGLIDVVTDWL